MRTLRFHLTSDGAAREDLPPMPRFLNRLLALPADDRNALSAALEVRARRVEPAGLVYLWPETN